MSGYLQVCIYTYGISRARHTFRNKLIASRCIDEMIALLNVAAEIGEVQQRDQIHRFFYHLATSVVENVKSFIFEKFLLPYFLKFSIFAKV
jgi:hypothetical protein